MIEDRLIDGKVTLLDLIAHAVAIGVKAGRGAIDYQGAWPTAADILNKVPEMFEHRTRIINLRDGVANSAEEMLK